MIDIYNYINEHTYEFFGVIFSIVYVILSIKQNTLCWIALIIASLFNMYAYYLIQLPLQTMMQVFFISTAIYGLYNWSLKTKSSKLTVTTWKLNHHIKWIIIGFIFTISLNIILEQTKLEIFNTNYPFSDSLIFVFNIIPMYMMGKKILESWIYFIVIDIYSGCFFYITEAYFFSFLFFCYIGFATHGYLTWKKVIK
tara:strand:- start:739 stop:1329 length:591 start_codon:yes stop_codon:yes gene_type:complete